MKKKSDNWKTETSYQKGIIETIETPSLKKIGLDLGLKVIGATIGYFTGKVTGKLLQKLPHLKDSNLEKTLAISKAFYGFMYSGTEIKNDEDKLKKIKIYPISFTLRD